MAGVVRRRVAARVSGTVQGVGFRPFAYRLADELGLGGFVRNDELGVAIEVEGAPERIEEFLRRMAAEAPPLAAIEAIEPRELEPRGERRFEILASTGDAAARAPVAPDVATCGACLAELFDPADRRFRYPFINCTACGPRFTIVRAVPYDRARTTMAGFEMCGRCRAEFEDPGDRRFHAQPNACPACGPSARLLDAGGAPLAGEPHRDAIAAAAALLAEGAVVAVKGVGGYHLACRAADATAIATLRTRKRRGAKPFALIAADLAAARALLELSDDDERLLAGRERPIVLAPRRPGAAVVEGVAPGCADLGVMLPHSPLHHLLVADAGEPLVLTSGNVSEEPIAFRDEDALRRLAPLADAFLVHDRPIQTRAEDSVVRSLAGEPTATPIVFRRARGYAPAPLPLPIPARQPLLACGAELKSTFCLAAGPRCWLGPHVGDLRHYEALRSFGEGIAHFERLFSIAPELVAHDLHPDYLSTRYALAREGVATIAVQHHHAHLAACLAEHGVEGPAVGAIFDGAGYGSDGTVWGGEILVGDCADFSRAGMLRPLRLPGGDAAVREPWRMACAWLAAALDERLPPLPAALDGSVEARDWETVAALATSPISPQTTSIGRLFDAVAALCGVRARIDFEGQAAIELEAVARAEEGRSYRVDLVEQGNGEGQTALVLDPREALRQILAELEAGAPVGDVAARFHNGLAAATAAACAAAAEAGGIGTVVLSGGVFQNRLLLQRTAERLRAAGLRVLIPKLLPPNDGGISFGQAAVATARSRS